MSISKKEEDLFVTLYNRYGYILDFKSKKAFDRFCVGSIEEALTQKYNLSQGKSLEAYLDDANEEKRSKLLLDLFTYYEENMEYEFNSDYKGDACFFNCSRYDVQMARIYEKCKSVVNRETGISAVTAKTMEELKVKFSSDYLSMQMDLMFKMQASNPTVAIGMAKELIESCCKTVLDELGIPYTKNDEVPQLADKTMAALNLLPSNVQPTDRGADAIKAVLGNLRAIPTKLAEIRNPFGSGHGKSASFQGLEVRHAKLAVGSSITFVDFIWSTFETQNREK